MSHPQRCHLLIGPPASGKSTLALQLAPLLTAPGDPPAVVLSTDRIRHEIFGDAAVQGSWRQIREHLVERLREAVTVGHPVIIDATHARRPWRLAFTQSLVLPVPVAWIGWWLTTPLVTCLAWNRARERQVPEPVILEMASALASKALAPCRSEGFAALVAIDPTLQPVDAAVLEGHLAILDNGIRNANQATHLICPEAHEQRKKLRASSVRPPGSYHW